MPLAFIRAFYIHMNIYTCELYLYMNEGIGIGLTFVLNVVTRDIGFTLIHLSYHFHHHYISSSTITIAIWLVVLYIVHHISLILSKYYIYSKLVYSSGLAHKTEFITRAITERKNSQIIQQLLRRPMIFKIESAKYNRYLTIILLFAQRKTQKAIYSIPTFSRST
jgi:hypothetical protein